MIKNNSFTMMGIETTLTKKNSNHKLIIISNYNSKTKKQTFNTNINY